MKPPNPSIPVKRLEPGGLIVTRKPLWITTLLGSCVSVTMFHRDQQLAAMCHGMLPEPRNSDPAKARPELRFLSIVIPKMIEAFLHRNAAMGDIEVKMFGGANIIEFGGEPHNNRWIGTANIATARELLKQAGLKVRSENVGGTRGCKIFFNTQTGEVLHKHLATRSP